MAQTIGGTNYGAPAVTPVGTVSAQPVSGFLTSQQTAQPTTAQTLSFLGQAPSNAISQAMGSIDPNYMRNGMPQQNMYQPQARNPAPTTGFLDNLTLQDTMGLITNGMGAVGSFLQGYSGLEQVRLGEQMLDENRRMNRINVNNQAQTYNTELAQQHSNNLSVMSPEQRAAALSQEEYMEQNALKGFG